jgi:hypothetical protein
MGRAIEGRLKVSRVWGLVRFEVTIKAGTLNDFKEAVNHFLKKFNL